MKLCKSHSATEKLKGEAQNKWGDKKQRLLLKTESVEGTSQTMWADVNNPTCRKVRGEMPSAPAVMALPRWEKNVQRRLPACSSLHLQHALPLTLCSGHLTKDIPEATWMTSLSLCIFYPRPYYFLACPTIMFVYYQLRPWEKRLCPVFWEISKT